MWDFIGIAGLLLLIVAAIASIFFAVKRNVIWKKWLAGAGGAFILFIVGVTNAPPPGSKEANQQNQVNSSQQQKLASTSQPQQQPQQSPIPLIQGSVTRVVDGDTIHVSMNGKDETIRFIGVDTPETVKPDTPVQPYGREASDYTKSQLTDKQVWIEKDVQERDKYERLLAYVWLAPPAEVSDKEIKEKMFNARLLMNGYAQLLTIPPDVKYVDYFTVYQKEAREGNKGLWGLRENQSTTSAPSQQIPSTPKVTSSPPPQAEKQSVTVYVTKTGEKYHRAGCQYLARSQIPMSLADAKAAGYTPCSKCGPPR